MNKKSCKIFSLICLVSFLFISLSGCGATGNDQGTMSAASSSTAEQTQAAVDKEPQKVSLWAYNANDNNDAILTSIVKAFEKIENAQVEITNIPRGEQFETKLNSAIAANMGPDVSYLDQPLVARFAKDGVLLELNSYMDGADGINKDEFFLGAFDTNLLDGKYYGLPLSHTCIAMFYNKDLVPNPPTTWSEMLEVAKKVYVKGKVSAFERPWDGGGGAWMFQAFIGVAGGSLVTPDNSKVTFDSPEGAEALNFFYKDMMQYSDPEVYNASNAFGNGMVAMRFSGSWDVDGYVKGFPNLKFGVALIPKKDGREFASNMGGEDIVVYKTAKNPDAAWALIKHITNEENCVPVAKLVTGNFPVRIKALEDSYYKNNEYISMFLEQAKFAQPRPRIISWGKINDECLGTAINDFIAGKKTAEQALKDAAAAANALIAEDK